MQWAVFGFQGWALTRDTYGLQQLRRVDSLLLMFNFLNWSSVEYVTVVEASFETNRKISWERSSLGFIESVRNYIIVQSTKHIYYTLQVMVHTPRITHYTLLASHTTHFSHHTLHASRHTLHTSQHTLYTTHHTSCCKHLAIHATHHTPQALLHTPPKHCNVKFIYFLYIYFLLLSVNKFFICRSYVRLTCFHRNPRASRQQK